MQLRGGEAAFVGLGDEEHKQPQCEDQDEERVDDFDCDEENDVNMLMT